MKKIINALFITSVVLLSGCIRTDLNAPEAQLQQGLSSSATQVLQDGGQLKVMVPIDVAFYPKTTRVTPQMTQVLARVTQTLKTYPSLQVKVSAFTDSRGDPKRNQLISLKRAMLVADYFRNHGVSSSRISVAGRGADKAIADNSSSSGRLKNRRLEIDLT